MTAVTMTASALLKQLVRYHLSSQYRVNLLASINEITLRIGHFGIQDSSAPHTSLNMIPTQPLTLPPGPNHPPLCEPSLTPPSVETSNATADTLHPQSTISQRKRKPFWVDLKRKAKLKKQAKRKRNESNPTSSSQPQPISIQPPESFSPHKRRKLKHDPSPAPSLFLQVPDHQNKACLEDLLAAVVWQSLITDEEEREAVLASTTAAIRALFNACVASHASVGLSPAAAVPAGSAASPPTTTAVGSTRTDRTHATCATCAHTHATDPTLAPTLCGSSDANPILTLTPHIIPNPTHTADPSLEARMQSYNCPESQHLIEASRRADLAERQVNDLKRKLAAHERGSARPLVMPAAALPRTPIPVPNRLRDIPPHFRRLERAITDELGSGTWAQSGSVQPVKQKTFSSTPSTLPPSNVKVTKVNVANAGPARAKIGRSSRLLSNRPTPADPPTKPRAERHVEVAQGPTLRWTRNGFINMEAKSTVLTLGKGEGWSPLDGQDRGSHGMPTPNVFRPLSVPSQ